MDVYVATNGAVRILDFNPIADTTSPLLFDWEELPYDWPRPTSSGSEAAAEAAGAAPDSSASGRGEAAGEAGAAGSTSAPAHGQNGEHQAAGERWPLAATAATAAGVPSAGVATNGAAAAAPAAANGAANGHGGATNGAASAAANGHGGEDECSSGDEGDDNLVDMRVVGQEGRVQPGVRQACGMPFDMLHLQDSMDDIMALLQRERAGS